MSKGNDILDSIIDDNENDEMMDPDHVEEEDDHSTKYLTLTDAQKKSIQKRKINTKYGYHQSIKWEYLTDESQFEHVDKFKGGFAEVLILK